MLPCLRLPSGLQLLESQTHHSCKQQFFFPAEKLQHCRLPLGSCAPSVSICLCFCAFVLVCHSLYMFTKAFGICSSVPGYVPAINICQSVLKISENYPKIKKAHLVKVSHRYQELWPSGYFDVEIFEIWTAGTSLAPFHPPQDVLEKARSLLRSWRFWRQFVLYHSCKRKMPACSSEQLFAVTWCLLLFVLVCRYVLSRWQLIGRAAVVQCSRDQKYGLGCIGAEALCSWCMFGFTRPCNLGHVKCKHT